MSLTEKEKRKIEEEEKYRHAVVASIKHSNHNVSQKHGVPLLLSIFLPGLGQLVKGEVKKGLLIFFGPAIAFFVFFIIGLTSGTTNGGDNTNGVHLLAMLGNLWFGYIILYIWQIIDAYNN